GGEPGVFSTTYEARLNYFHVFQPEAFLTVAAHEAAWCCFHGRPSLMSDKQLSLLDKVRASLANVAAGEVALWRRLANEGLLSFSADRRYGEPVGTTFLQTLVVDRLAYCSVYDRDADLFWFWYMAYFCQLPSAYASPLVLSRRQTMNSILRL